MNNKEELVVNCKTDCKTKMEKECICQINDRQFHPLNTTEDYTGIDIAISNMGYIRCRTYYGDEQRSNGTSTQDVIIISHCPLCGRKLQEGGRK